MLTSLTLALAAFGAQGSEPSPFESLRVAVNRNYVAGAREHLSSLPILDVDPREGEPPAVTKAQLNRWLHQSIEREDVNLARVLIELGADPNGRVELGRTPLFKARTPRAVRLLVAAGADPLARDDHGRSTLSGICRWSPPAAHDAAQELLRHGAQPSLEDAVGLGDVPRIRELLAAREGRGVTLDFLGHAICIAPDRAAHALLDHAAFSDQDGAAPVPEAGDEGSSSWFSSPHTPLLAAMQDESFDLAVRLILEGATGLAPGELAGATYHSPSEWFDGDLLDRAIHHGHFGLARALLDAGLEVDRSADFEGASEDRLAGRRVARAAFFGHDEILELLLQRGAPSESEDPAVAPTLLAGLGGHAGCYEALTAAGAARSFHAEVSLGSARQVEEFLDMDSNLVYAPDARFGLPPLAWAVIGGNAGTASVLLRRGADPNLEHEFEGLSSYRPSSGYWLPERRGIGRANSILTFCLGDIRYDRGTPDRWAELLSVSGELIGFGAAPGAASVAALALLPGEAATAQLMQLVGNAKGDRPAARFERVAEDRADWGWRALGLLCDSGAGMSSAPLDVRTRTQRVNILIAGGAAATPLRGGSYMNQGRGWQPVEGVVRALMAAGAEVPEEVAYALGWEERPAADLGALEHLDIKAASKRLGAALFQDEVEVVSALVGSHPSLLASTVKGATQRRSPRVAHWLLDEELVDLGWHGANDPTLLTAWAWSPTLVERLLGLGFEANPWGHFDTPLLAAAASRSPEAVRLLVAAGADPRARSSSGATVLERALTGGHDPLTGDPTATVQALLECGADPLQIPRGAGCLADVTDWDELEAAARDRLRALLTAHMPAKYLR